MSESYGPATVTPVTEVKRESDIKTEPRVNGYSQASIIPTLPPPSNHHLPSSSSSGLTMTITPQHTEDNPGVDSKVWNSGREQQCCLVENGLRCKEPAGNASYSKRIQKTVAQRKLKLYMDNSAQHIYICDYHKNVIQSLRTKRKRKDSEEDSGETDSEHPEVDLYQLQVNTLRRYKKHFKVSHRPGMNKAQLADNLTRHFKTIPVMEKEALTFFIYMVKTNKSKFDRERREDD